MREGIIISLYPEVPASMVSAYERTALNDGF